MPADGTLEPTEPSRPMRKDAARSRQVVLQAAAVLFAEQGTEVSFDEIARHAGVGVGTVYRRFPKREDLLEALFAEKLGEMLRSAEEAALISDPWEAIVTFCTTTVRQQSEDRSLSLMSAGAKHHSARFGDFRDQMSVIVGDLITRGQHAHLVRPDLTAVDLAVMTHLISRIAVPGDEPVWPRYLAMFLESIRTRPDQQPLSTPAPDVAMIQEIAERL